MFDDDFYYLHCLDLRSNMKCDIQHSAEMFLFVFIVEYFEARKEISRCKSFRFV